MTVNKNDKISGWIKWVQDHVKGLLKRLSKWRRSGAGVVCLAAVVCMVVVAAAVCWWSQQEEGLWAWMSNGSGGKVSNGETLRNFVLVVGLVFGIPLALWRSIVANRQVETSQQNLRNERYQMGANMLGSDTLATRLGGIYALEHLAKDYPDEYHIKIMKPLCAFVRHPPTDKSFDAEDSVRPDVDTAMQAIGTRGEDGKKLESDGKWHLNLHGANLKGASLIDTDLTGAKLEYANLEGADMTRADLTGAKMSRANLTSARMWYTKLADAYMGDATFTDAEMLGANLTGANMLRATLTGAEMPRVKLKGAKMYDATLTGANMSDVDISGAWLGQVKGLTQESLNMACALKGSPPNISESTCAKTDEPLEWTGGAGEPVTWVGDAGETLTWLDDLDEPRT